MPEIASLEDLKAARKDLLEAKGLNELKAVFKKWRRIGWKNVCKLKIGKWGHLHMSLFSAKYFLTKDGISDLNLFN